MSSPPLPFLAKTKVSWTGEQDGDLGFLENEVVKVFHVVDELWWQGSLSRNGAEGIFPRDFVEVISAPATVQNTPTKVVPPFSSVQGNHGASPMGIHSHTPEKCHMSPSAKYVTSPVNGFTSTPPHILSSSTTPLKTDRREEYRMAKINTPSKSPGYGHVYKGQIKSQLTPALDDCDESFDENNTSFLHKRKGKQKAPQFYSQHVLSLGLTKAHTTDNLFETKRLSQMISADNSPVKMRSADLSQPANMMPAMNFAVSTSARQDEFYQTIAQKKQELEKQLHHLKELERSHIQEKTLQLGDDSYISEDLSLSKRNYMSREELGHKLEVREDLDSEDLPPPPPPKHARVPFDANDFKASGATLDDKLRSQTQYPEEWKNSMKSLQSDVLNLSELSATSAGSFSRHKFERDFLHGQPEAEGVEADVAKLNLNDNEELMNSVFTSKKSKHPNIFKMLMKKKPEQNLMEQRLLQEPDNWQMVKHDLNRMNTLTTLDKQARTKRVARSEANFIIKPLEYITDVNTSEVFGPDNIEVVDTEVNIRKVAEFLMKYDHDYDFNDLITDVSVKFGSHRPSQIRAILLHLCKFRIIDETGKILQMKPKVHEVMAKGEATIFQLNYLFKKLLEALRIPAEVVFGFWKKPNEFYHSDQFLVNHCWLSVMMQTDERGNGAFRLIDLMCFQNGLICNIEGFNEFYFLTAPIDIVSTHIPSVIELQHVCPPVDLNVAFHLPRLYSSFKKHDLEFINFNNSLTRMHDLEFFEADIKIPVSVELFTLIKTSRKTSNDYTLCQIYWKGPQRIARIKAVLPENESIGVLQIFAGQKGLQTHFDNIHELACVIPLYHTGTSKASAFVPRFPTIRSQNNDLYIRHPQLSAISINNTYSFEVDVHPSMGLNSGSGIMNRDFKLVVESPSGKYTKLIKDEPHKPYGTHQLKLHCQEKGLYRGLVIGDSGNSWYVFAQWEC
ncbi:SH3 domain-containing protein [Metschnikowia aff. pulcherrima]|uniref:SH3 domain-containing protein n=1 Tax=Metschnikowia aff. pulcherrima TaxID=2163413 RepID=A0A4P6XG86_9ASCO|nr:SH3 domain-containing protein [Metschnikowia aff. pulcherrima]